MHCLWILIVLVTTTFLSASCSNGEQIVSTPEQQQNILIPNCTILFRLELPPRPNNQHKQRAASSHHQQAPVLTVDTYQQVELTCTCCCQPGLVQQIYQQIGLQNTSNGTDWDVNTGMLLYEIVTSNSHVVMPVESKKRNVDGKGHDCIETEKCERLSRKVECDENNMNTENQLQQTKFYIYGNNLGQGEISATLVWGPQQLEEDGDMDVLLSMKQKNAAKKRKNEPPWNIMRAKIFVTEETLLENNFQADYATDTMENENGTVVKGKWEESIRITILLKPRKFYMASDLTAAVIAVMIALSVGCCNDLLLFRTKQLKQTKLIAAYLICQHILIPALALGVGTCFMLSKDQAFGLFITTSVPGGGLAYLLTYLAHGDQHLSAAISLITSVVNLFTAPLWMYLVGWFWFNRPMHIGRAVGWLSLITTAQIVGTGMRSCNPSVAHAVLTWVTRPLLLLSGILLVTLGVYINHYAITEVNQGLIFSLLVLITSGFILGWAVGHFTSDGIPIARTTATETAVFNGLICLPLLRTTVHAPEGDLAAVASMWAVFLSPIPLVYHTIVSIIHRWVTEYLDKKRKQNELNSMAVMIGSGTVGGMGAASVVAVAAAAVAVAPAITAGAKTNFIANPNSNNQGNGTEVDLEQRIGRQSTSRSTKPESPDALSSSSRQMEYVPMLSTSATQSPKYKPTDVNAVPGPVFYMELLENENQLPTRALAREQIRTSSGSAMKSSAQPITQTDDRVSAKVARNKAQHYTAERKADKFVPPPYTNL